MANSAWNGPNGRKWPGLMNQEIPGASHRWPRPNMSITNRGYSTWMHCWVDTGWQWRCYTVGDVFLSHFRPYYCNSTIPDTVLSSIWTLMRTKHTHSWGKSVFTLHHHHPGAYGNWGTCGTKYPRRHMATLSNQCLATWLLFCDLK